MSVYVRDSNAIYAEPYYEGYIPCPPVLNADQNCRLVYALQDQINAPYTGSTTADRIAWLANRRQLLRQRVAFITLTLQRLGVTDTRDLESAAIAGIGGAVQSLFTNIPGLGGVIGAGIGGIAAAVAGLLDKSQANQAALQDQLYAYNLDAQQRLLPILAEHDAEYNELMLPRRLLMGGLVITVLALAYVLWRTRLK